MGQTMAGVSIAVGVGRPYRLIGSMGECISVCCSPILKQTISGSPGYGLASGRTYVRKIEMLWLGQIKSESLSKALDP